MKNSIPTFDFKNPGISEEEFVEAEKFKPSSLQPGEHKVKIIGSRFTGMAENDTSWMKFRVFYVPQGVKAKLVEAEGKFTVIDQKGDRVPSASDFFMIPTKTVLYNPQNSKRPTAVFAGLKKKLAGLGHTIDTTNLEEVIPPLFGKSDLLKGIELTITIGYTKPYVAYNADTEKFSLVSKAGDVMTLANCENSFDSRDQVEAEAAIAGLAFQQFSEILKYVPSKVDEPETNGDEPDSDWD